MLSPNNPDVLLISPPHVPDNAAAINTRTAPRPWGLVSLLVVGVAAFVMCFGMLGAVPLFNPDEGLYAEPAREMVEMNEWTTTLLNYVVRFTKPPLVIWAMAFTYKLLGVSEFSARLFVASCAFTMILITYAFAAKYLGRRIAFLSALMLITSPLFVAVGREAITDMPLVLFMAGAIMAFYAAFQEKSSSAKWTGYVLVACALMTKGPVGLLLPAVIMPVYFYLRGQLKQAWAFYSIPTGIALVSLLALPWYVVEIYITKGAYFNEFIMRENFARFTSVVDAHKGPIWYHLAAIMAGFFPWSLCLPQITWSGCSSLFSRGDNKTGSQENAIISRLKTAHNRTKALDQPSQLILLCALTAIVTTGFFSVSVSKLLPYTLPAFPFLALIVASYLDRLATAGQTRKLLFPVLAAAAVYGGATLIMPLVITHMKEAPVELIGIANAYGLCVLVALSSAVALSLRKHLFPALVFFACGLFALTAFFGTQLLPSASKVFEEEIPEYGRETAASADPILLYDIRKPGFPFYSHRKVILPPDHDALVDDLSAVKSAFVVTRARNVDELLAIKGLKLKRRGDRFAFMVWAP